MPRSLAATQWNSKECEGKDTQGHLPLIGGVPVALLAEQAFIERASWEGCLRYAVQRTGRDDFEVADEMAISQSYMSKVLKGTAGLYGRRLVRFMRITGTAAPLQWLADQMGYELRKKEPLSEAERLRRENEDLRRQLRRSA